MVQRKSGVEPNDDRVFALLSPVRRHCNDCSLASNLFVHLEIAFRD
jgi:hypothetical protein